MDGDHLPYQVLAQVILRDFKLTKKIKTISGSYFLFIKNWNKGTFTFVSGTLPSFLHSKKLKNPSHSSSGKTSSKFDFLEIKIKEKTKWEGKAEQSYVYYFMKTIQSPSPRKTPEISFFFFLNYNRYYIERLFNPHANFPIKKTCHWWVTRRK